MEEPKRKRGRPKKEPAPLENDVRKRIHQGFAAGFRYAIARFWDNIEMGGNTYVLEQVYQDVIRCEHGQVPPEIIDTNRGQKVTWEDEFDLLRRRFKRRSEEGRKTPSTREPGELGIVPVMEPSDSAGTLARQQPMEPSDSAGTLARHRPRKRQVEWKDI